MKGLIVFLIVSVVAAADFEHFKKRNFARNQIIQNVNSNSNENYENLDVDESAHKNDRRWQNYKSYHQKSYESHQEEAIRYSIYRKNDAMINAHNEKYVRGEVLYIMKHNQFSDMTDEEIQRIRPQMHHNRSSIDYSPLSTLEQAPETLSFKNSCLPVENQGSCGSCWAFASAAQVESQLKLKDPKFNTHISPQYLLDCAPNGGCQNGGNPAKGLEYMYEHGMIALNDYPYTMTVQDCKLLLTEKMEETIPFSPKAIDLPGDEQELMKVLYAYGPVVVGIQAPKHFSFYNSGIFSEIECPTDCNEMNHAMLLVGYGKDNTTYGEPVEYWLLKNSYGTNWGEDGYVRMVKNLNGYKNDCNIACVAFFAQV